MADQMADQQEFQDFFQDSPFVDASVAATVDDNSTVTTTGCRLRHESRTEAQLGEEEKVQNTTAISTTEQVPQQQQQQQQQPFASSGSNHLQDTPPSQSYDLGASATVFYQPPRWPSNQDPIPITNSSVSLQSPIFVPNPALSLSPTSLSLHHDHDLPAEPMTDGPATSSQIPPVASAAASTSSPSAHPPPLHPLNLSGSPAPTQPPFSSIPLAQGLTAAQREKLKSLVMPAHLQYHSPRSEAQSPISPVDGDRMDACGSSPDHPALTATTSKASSRKRKSTDDLDDDDDEEFDGDGQQPVKKTAHNMIEKRYRTNLNDKISALRDSVPSLRIMSKSARGEDTTVDREELHGLTPAHKLNKATVLSKATEYIRHLEKRNNRLTDENAAMQARIGAFEKLFMAGAMNGAMSPLQQTPAPMQYGGGDPSSYINQGLGSTARGPDPAGMIQVPDDMKRILSAQMATGQPYPVGGQQPAQPQQQPQQQTPQQQPQPFQNNAMVRQQQIQQQQQLQQRRWQQNAPPGYYGKLMVGSLAGLMILEAAREKEVSQDKTEGRGLFAMPLSAVQHMVSSTSFNLMGYHVPAARVITSLQFVFLVGTILLVFFPSFFHRAERKDEKSREDAPTLHAVPSLASPMHVRRQAWLTAVQTVWVPHHNWVLEASALILEMLKLSLRNLIGIAGYQALTGLSEEQEVARVKAWGIALDAQLTGGDDEINKARLSLSYLASCTLPDTPLRLMQKALHLRVLLWELRQAPFTFGALNLVAVDKARRRWNGARQLSRMLYQLRRSTTDLDADDELPEHLAILLEQDCDQVLDDAIVQRAYNLAWNLPTDQDAIGSYDGMDAVVEDSAIRSPLDAVSAWFSTCTLQKALVMGLDVDRHDSESVSTIDAMLNLAVKTAPIGSTAQTRALVARAVLLDDRRGVHIAAALKVVGSLNPETALQKFNVPLIKAPMPSVSTPDSLMALRCAMAMAHLGRFAEEHPSFSIIETISPGGHLTLLGWVAAFKLMKQLHGHPVGRDRFSHVLEQLAGSLRIWIGSSDGDSCDLAVSFRNKVVESCLEVTKSLVGMEVDTGYGSLSDSEDLDEADG